MFDWIANIFKGIFGANMAESASNGKWVINSENPISNLVGSVINRYTGAGLTSAELEANAFSASEADKARAWNEQMYNKYESPSAMMAQYRDAGLNPALMYQSSTNGDISTSTTQPSSVTPASPENLLDSIMTFAKLRSEIRLINSEAAANENRARLDQIRSQYEGDILSQQLVINQNTISRLEKELDSIDYDNAEKRFNVSNQQLRLAILAAEKTFKDRSNQNLLLENALLEWEKNLREMYGMTANFNIRNWFVYQIMKAFNNIDVPVRDGILSTPPGSFPMPSSD